MRKARANHDLKTDTIRPHQSILRLARNVVVMFGFLICDVDEGMEVIAPISVRWQLKILL